MVRGTFQYEKLLAIFSNVVSYRVQPGQGAVSQDRIGDINNRFVLGWDHKPQIAEIDFSLVLCFERFFWKNQQIFPLLLVKYLSFREGRDGKKCECVSVAEPTGRVVAIVLERGPVNSRRN